MGCDWYKLFGSEKIKKMMKVIVQRSRCCLYIRALEKGMEIVSARFETNIIGECESVMDVKIKKIGRKNRALGDSTVNYFVRGFLGVKKCGGLSAVQVVTQPKNNSSRERCVMN